MFTKQDIIASIQMEHMLIKHLHSKLTTEHLTYKPQEGTRTVKELLEYISRMTLLLGSMLQNKAYTPEKAKALRLTAESRNMITDFSAAMDEQLIFITNYITEVSDEDLASEVDLFGTGHAMPIRSYFINILFKNYAAYRMQLFLYMKNGLGMTELNTKNLWMGHDGSM